MFEQPGATAIDSLDLDMPTARANWLTERYVGLGVAALLLLDLLAAVLGSWKGQTALGVAVPIIALGLVLRAWLRRPRVAPRPAEPAQDALPFVMGAPHIDGPLWAKVASAMHVEYAARQIAVTVREEQPAAGLLVEHSSLTPFADASGAQGDEWHDEPRVVVEVEAPPRSGTRETRPYRRTAT
jgi:hypothetical protein